MIAWYVISADSLNVKKKLSPDVTFALYLIQSDANALANA
jgi:hypothetical protein